jgi:polysaccharide biosynthesis/export protein
MQAAHAVACEGGPQAKDERCRTSHVLQQGELTTMRCNHFSTGAALVAVCISLACAAGAQAQSKQRPAAAAGAVVRALAAGRGPDEREPQGSSVTPPAAAQVPARQARVGASALVDPVLEPPTAAEVEIGYPLGVGDVVRVSVFQQPDMATETRVSEAGTITVPLLGPVPVGGVTAKRAEDRIAALLKARGFVVDPQVVVTVLQFKSRQVSVLGYVARPGRYPLEEGSYYLTDVLSMAGGLLADASDSVTLMRKAEGGLTKRYDLHLPQVFRGSGAEGNPKILPGDTLYVDKAPVFYIYGEVQRPGAYRLEKDMTVMQALSVGGGLTQRGTEKNMRMTRRDAQGRQVTVTPVMNDLLRPDDVIFVRESLF